MSGSEARPPVADTFEPEWIDGPSLAGALPAALTRVLIVALPPAALFGGLIVAETRRPEDVIGLAVFGLICLGFVVFFTGAIVAGNASVRRQGIQSVLANAPRSRASLFLTWSVAWETTTSTLRGSLHAYGGSLWIRTPHAGFASTGILELAADQIVAVELEPAASAWEWFRLGSPLVVLHLRDGRRIRLATWAPAPLATHLRRLLERAEEAPVGPPLDLDDATTEQIARVLVRRHPFVALVVGDDDGSPPFVALHGASEPLAGALDLAREALLRQRKALAPYVEARPAPGNTAAGSSGNQPPSVPG